MTQIYQQNVHGGTSTAAKDGRYAGSYAFESQVDLGTLAGIAGAELYALVEGGWPDVGGIDAPAVGNYFGVNADAIEGEWGELSELWFEQALFDRTLLFRFGKIDLAGGFECRGCEAAFDGNKYANDETTQFLNGALVNNPTIPFPDRTLGLALFGSPAEAWHLGLAVAARDDEDTSWGSANDGVFAILEGTFLPRYEWVGPMAEGQYRAGVWYSADRNNDAVGGDQRGVYLSASQPVWCREGNSEDSRALSLFARAGWTDGPGAELADFWSFGAQYQGLWNPDGSDVLGIGLARGNFVHASDPDAPVGSETVWELYYNMPITSEIVLSPSVQYIIDPGGDHGGKDALVLGLRLQIDLE
ncbi:MAG: carbohydrate porin [Phycisphaerales bacterium]|nr:MAG: carbohydrate porin [Phycisphaerales bacterium]